MNILYVDCLWHSDCQCIQEEIVKKALNRYDHTIKHPKQLFLNHYCSKNAYTKISIYANFDKDFIDNVRRYVTKEYIRAIINNANLSMDNNYECYYEPSNNDLDYTDYVLPKYLVQNNSFLAFHPFIHKAFWRVDTKMFFKNDNCVIFYNFFSEKDHPFKEYVTKNDSFDNALIEYNYYKNFRAIRRII